MKKRCAYCGKTFEVNNKNQRYCSTSCKNNGKARRKRYGKDKYEPVIVDKSPVVYKPNLSGKEVLTRKCPVCGKIFETVYDTKVYCSETCKRKASKRRAMDREIDKASGKINLTARIKELHSSNKADLPDLVLEEKDKIRIDLDSILEDKINERKNSGNTCEWF